MSTIHTYLSKFWSYDGRAIQCKKWQDEDLTARLSTAGCLVEFGPQHNLVTFPPGTRKAVLLPEMQETRYYYALPDDTAMIECTMRGDASGLREGKRLH